MAIDPVFHNIRFTSRSDTGVGVVLYGNGSCKVPGIGDVIADAPFLFVLLGGSLWSGYRHLDRKHRVTGDTPIIRT
jgi:hypothetical protein